MSFYRQIRVFRTVMTSGSLTEAASRLFLTQPAVTKQLHALEAQIGAKLFSREGHRLRPNKIAHALFKESESPIAAMLSLENFARHMRSEEALALRIVAMPMMARLWLPDHVGRLFEALPRVTFEFRVAPSESVTEMLEQGQADIGIARVDRRTSHKGSRALLITTAVCILPRGHRLGRKAIITPTDVAGENFILLAHAPFMREDVLAAFASEGVTPFVKADVELEETAVALVEAGHGVSVIDSFSAHRRRSAGAAIEIAEFRPLISMEIGIMRGQNVHNSDMVKTAIECLKSG